MKLSISYFLMILFTLNACGSPTSPQKTPQKASTVASSVKLNPTSKSVFNPQKSTVEPIDPEQLPGDVYALVNGKPLTDAAINEKLSDFPSVPDNQAQRVHQRIANFLVNQMVVSQIIKTGQLVIDPQDLATSQERFEEILKTNDWTQKDFMDRNKISEGDLQQSLMIQAYFWSQVTPEKIQEKFTLIQDNVEQARTVDILLKGGPSLKDDERDILKKEITELRERALKGEDFTELAKKFSDDPNVGQHNGRVGPITKRSYYAPQLLKATFELKEKDEISEVIKTEMGYMIIKLVDIQEDMISAQGGRVVQANQLAESLALQEVQKEFHEVVTANNTIVKRLPPPEPNPQGRPPEGSGN